MTDTPLLRRAAAAGLLLVAALAASARAQDEPPQPQLPAGVVARVFGEDVTEEHLLDRLARRYETTPKGREILEQVLEDAVVEAEARRRGVVVTDEEARAYGEQVAETIRRERWGGKTFDDVLRETNTSYEDFLRTAKDYLVRAKMARQDLGTKPDQELPEHRLKLWAAELRKKAAVRYEGLPPGVLAQADGVTIDRRRLARELRTRLPPETVNGIVMELALGVATRHEVARAGIEVTDADVDAQVARIRESFEKRTRGQEGAVPFEQFLEQTLGMREADLRKDPTFRARVGLERLLSRDIGEEQVRRHWEQNRLAYGERALVRQVFVPAEDAGGARFGGTQLPTFREAQDLALRAKVEILERSGGVSGAAGSRRPLGDVVTQVAKEFESAPDRRRAAGEPVAWTHVDTQDHAKLDEAVFTGAVGQVLGPVQSKLGWHVLLVEERRPAPAYEEVRGKVREELLRAAVHQFQLQLRGSRDLVLR